jgi:hypothetical protein
MGARINIDNPNHWRLHWIELKDLRSWEHVICASRHFDWTVGTFSNHHSLDKWRIKPSADYGEHFLNL